MPDSRREFLKRSTLCGAAVCAAGGSGWWLHSRDRFPEPPAIPRQYYDYRVQAAANVPDLAVMRGADIPRIITAAVDALGGIDAFIVPGDRVVLKPNVSWDRTAEQGANTHPAVVRTIAELCLRAGAREVLVTDNSCNDPRRCFRRSGVGRESENAGAVVLLPEQRHFKRVNMGGGVLGYRPVLRPFLEADKVINLPVLKQHHLCRMTAGMKNWYGMIGGIRAQLHQNIHDSIVDLTRFLRPTLIVLDVTRMMIANGPSGGSPSDVVPMDTIVAGTDQVAVDSFGAGLLHLDPQSIPFLQSAAALGLGRMDLSTMTILQPEAA